MRNSENRGPAAGTLLTSLASRAVMPATLSVIRACEGGALRHRRRASARPVQQAPLCLWWAASR
ncbi:MAG: hypothetical protein EBS56_01410 [Planctomycetia bacterium]|nr:hypothetical protein [Planctomycetia bacterium]